MSDDVVLKPDTVAKPKVQQPRLYKVILLNDDYTPREFVVQVLKAVFRTSEDQAYRIMMTAHQKGTCVVAAFTRDIAESKATEATDMGRSKGYPLAFSTEPEECPLLRLPSVHTEGRCPRSGRRGRKSRIARLLMTPPSP